jgi:group I intron endonuclease
MDFNSAIALLRKTCGVYCVMHLETLRLYVGSSFNCGGRIKTHIRDSNNGSRSCFHRALRQYGVDSFSFDLLEECHRPLLNEREEQWIRFYNSAGLNGFNTMSKPGATYGWFMSEATKQRMRESQRKANTPEKRERIRQALLGRKRPDFSLAWMEKLRAANIGRKCPEETREKISMALTGKHPSEETRKKIGDVRRGKTLPPEWKEKVRLSLIGNKRMLGKQLTPEHKAKIRAACKGKLLGIKLSLEHRRKLSEAHKGKKWSEAQHESRKAKAP